MHNKMNIFVLLMHEVVIKICKKKVNKETAYENVE